MVPEEIDINVNNIPPNGSGRNPSSAGSLTATFSCPSLNTGNNCGFCQAANGVLQGTQLLCGGLCYTVWSCEYSVPVDM